MYQVELTEAALNDLDDFSKPEIEDVFYFLISLSETPQPAGVQAIPLLEAAGGMAFCHETPAYSLYYEIYEAMHAIKVVAIFKKINLN